MKKILFVMYQEGVSGYDYATRANSLYVLRRMVADTNVAAKPFIETGVEVYACDIYGIGRDIVETDLLKEIKLIKTDGLEELSRNGLDGVILIGCHAKNGAEKAFLSYTKNAVAWFEYSLNGMVLGDIGIAAAYFGNFNVPIIGVTGDDGACREATELLGDIISRAVVKEALSRNSARAKSIEDAEKEITLMSNNALQNYKSCKVFKVLPPYHVEVLYSRVDYADGCIYWNRLSKRKDALRTYRDFDAIHKYNDLLL